MLICHFILFMGRDLLMARMMMAENKMSLSLGSFLDPVPYLECSKITTCLGWIRSGLLSTKCLPKEEILRGR
jgi:hypothetical protein